MSKRHLPLLLLGLVGCTEPPVLDPVTSKLADQILTTAEPQMRLFIGVAGVIAESCTVDGISGYTFQGETAHALGVTEAEVVTSESGDHTWTFSHVGIDGTDGTLILTTDSERTTFSVSYTAANNTLVSGDYHVLSCDPPAATAEAGDTGTVDTGAVDTGAADTGTDTGGTDTADTGGTDTGGTDTGATTVGDWTVNVSGNLDFETVDGTNHLEIEGDKPYSSLTWLPPTALGPMSGWAHWGDQEQNPSEEITLEGAANIDYDARQWPGKASGARWVRSITIGLP